MSPQPLPPFRYHPDPLVTGAFEADDAAVCICCGQARGYIYRAHFLTRDWDGDGPKCPWCIASGEAARRFNGRFFDRDGLEPVEDAEAVVELLHRTPSFMGHQTERWLSHHGDFCAYLGKASQRKDLDDETVLPEDLETAAGEMGMGTTAQDVRRALAEADGDGVEGYLFRCLHCSALRAYIDF